MPAARPLLLLALVACCGAAAQASAAGPGDTYALRITATSVATFDHTSAPLAQLECETSARAEGVRTTVFHSTRSTLVRFAGGRIHTVLVGGLEGTVKLSGRNTANRDCTGGEKSRTPQACRKSTRTFTNARVTLSSAAAESITVHPPRVALRRVHCPQEPGEITALPLGPVPGPLHVSLKTLNNPRTTTITLTASATRTKTYGPDERGTVRQRTAWTLTFVRTAR